MSRAGDGFYRRGRFWWCRQDPQTGKPRSTGETNLAAAREWREMRKFELLTQDAVDELWDAFADCKARDFVYFVRDESSGLVKIGYSYDVDLRLRSLQGQSSAPLKLILCMRGNRELEQRTHRVFAAYRHHGEWFERKGMLDQFISDLEKEPRSDGSWP